MTESSITIVNQDEAKNYLKAKKSSKFRRRASLRDSMFKFILHAKVKA